MLAAGFEGRYTNKAGKTAEGSATFFRKYRYRAVAMREIRMNELFADILANPAAHTIHSQFLPFLQSSPTLVQALSRVRLQWALLSAPLNTALDCKPVLQGSCTCLAFLWAGFQVGSGHLGLLCR